VPLGRREIKERSKRKKKRREMQGERGVERCRGEI
jgi:hypothetical protein